MYAIPNQKRSTEECSKFKGPETRQVQERPVSTLEHTQVQKWDRTRRPEEQAPPPPPPARRTRRTRPTETLHNWVKRQIR